MAAFGSMTARAFLFLLLAVVSPCGSAIQAQTASDVSRADAVKLAADLHSKIRSAYDRIRRDLGPGAFQIMERQTTRGTQTIGEIWTQYLTDAGYPSNFDQREEAARRLSQIGLDNSAITILVLGPAREEAIEHLLGSLRRAASAAD